MGKIYEKTVWVDEITPLDADNMNKIENAIESLSSMAVSNISDGGGKGSVVQIGNAANGESSAAFGVGSAATGMGSHAEGLDTKASAQGSHAEGWQSVASGEYSHAEGQSNATAWQSHAENVSTASGEQSHSEGAAIASGKRSHAENEAKAEGANSHAEGSSDALAKGGYSHAEGGGQAYGGRSHAEGSGRTGQATEDAGAWEAHAEGAGVALGTQSHAEGNSTVASGEQSHVEGINNTASGKASHAQGIGNEALAEGEFVTGKYSNPEKNAVEDTVSGFLMRVGSGKSNTDRSNCFTIDADETVSMKKAVISTDLISRPFSVINKDYADAHYVQVSSYTKESSDGYTQIIPKGSTIFENTSSAAGSIGFYAKIGMYNLSIYEATQHPATDLVSKYVSYFFQPQYKQSRPLMYDVWVFPIYFYNTSLAVYCDADGTENENGQFIKVTCRMYYAKRS